MTLERFDAGDSATVSTLAAAERAGLLTTVATGEGGRLARQPARPADNLPAATADFARLPDGRVIERFGTQPTPLYLFGAGHVGRGLALALAPLPFAVVWIDPRPGAFRPTSRQTSLAFRRAIRPASSRARRTARSLP